MIFAPALCTYAYPTKILGRYALLPLTTITTYRQADRHGNVMVWRMVASFLPNRFQYSTPPLLLHMAFHKVTPHVTSNDINVDALNTTKGQIFPLSPSAFNCCRMKMIWPQLSVLPFYFPCPLRFLIHTLSPY